MFNNSFFHLDVSFFFLFGFKIKFYQFSNFYHDAIFSLCVQVKIKTFILNASIVVLTNCSNHNFRQTYNLRRRKNRTLPWFCQQKTLTNLINDSRQFLSSVQILYKWNIDKNEKKKKSFYNGIDRYIDDVFFFILAKIL